MQGSDPATTIVAENRDCTAISCFDQKVLICEFSKSITQESGGWQKAEFVIPRLPFGIRPVPVFWA